jgi:hypothetical protein
VGGGDTGPTTSQHMMRQGVQINIAFYQGCLRLMLLLRRVDAPSVCAPQVDALVLHRWVHGVNRHRQAVSLLEVRPCSMAWPCSDTSACLQQQQQLAAATKLWVLSWVAPSSFAIV